MPRLFAFVVVLDDDEACAALVQPAAHGVGVGGEAPVGVEQDPSPQAVLFGRAIAADVQQVGVADVNLNGFYSQSYIRIPVFDGITSIQRATLIPLPENGYPDGLRPDGERIIEGESPEL